MRSKWLLVSSLFIVGIFLLPFSYSSETYISHTAPAKTLESVSLLAQVNTAVSESTSAVWPAILRQIDGVLEFAAQTIDAVNNAPSEFFDSASNNPPQSADEVLNFDPTVNADNQLPGIPAPQLYEGTLIINVPLETQRLTVEDTALLGSAAIQNGLSVGGSGSFAGLSAGSAQLGSLAVSGNTQLNTLSVTGLVNFAFLTAGNLTVTNSLQALSGITTGGADVDLQGGDIFAANVINQLVAGDNIEIDLTDPNAPVITADVPNFSLGSRGRSLNGITGSLTLVGGTDVSVSVSGSDITLANTSDLSTVAGRGGCTDCILDADVINSLTIASGTIDNTVIGATTPAAATFTTVTVTDTATSTFGGSINVTSGCVAVNGVCLGGGVAQLNDLSDVTLSGPSTNEVLRYNGSAWVNSDPSVLGLGDGTYLGLTDTPGSYLSGAVVFTNATSSALTQSTNFTFDGSQVAIGSTTAVTALTVAGDVSILGQQAVRFYNPSNTNYVGFQASSSVSSNTVWTLPAVDGNANEFLVTNGSGTLRFADSSILGVVDDLNDLTDVTLSGPALGEVLVYDGSVWVNQATSTLGLGDGTFLGLSDTPGSFIANAVLTSDAAGAAVVQSSNLTFNGTQLLVGTSTAATTLTVGGDASLLNRRAIRFYDTNSTNYVGLRASSSLSGDVVWTLPAGDGTGDQVMVTDGSGNLRFADVSAIGGGATTYLGLTDTPGSFLNRAVPYVATDTIAFSSNLTFTGTRLGIGTDTPSDELTVHGSVFFGPNASTPGLTYQDGDNEIGIGTADPEETLNVEGGSVLQRGARTGDTYTMQPISSINLPDTAYDVFVVGTRAYVVTGSSGDDFHVIDISDRASPVVVGSTGLATNANDVYVSGQYAYAVSDVAGNDFHVIDISDPSSPAEVASINLSTSANGVTVQGRYAYVTTNNTSDDFHVIDISNPLSPVEVGTLDLPSDANDVAVRGDYAYVGTDASTHGFAIIDVSTPSSPSVAGTTTLPAQVNDVVVRGNYAYLTSEAAGDDFHIVDISNPTSPSITGSTDLSTGGNGVSVAGAYAYVATAGTGDDIHVIDISDVSTPTEVGSAELAAGAALAITTIGRYAYVVSSVTGDSFHVIDVTGVEAQSVLAHSLESGNLSVLGDIVAAGNVSLSEGLRTGVGGIQTDGSLLIQGVESSIFSANVGIGTTTAPYALTVDGDVLIDGQLYDSSYTAGTYGQLLMANGVGQVWTATSSLGLSESFTTSADLAALISDETGTAGNLVFSTAPTFTGTVLVSSITASSAISLSGTAANISLGSNYLSGDGDDEGIFITAGGSVGVGTTSPASELSVEGTIMAANLYGGATSLSTDAQGNIIRTPSDQRLKTNVSDITDALDIVLALRGVRYEWIDTQRFGEQTEVGFLAQEVDLVLPEVVRKGGEYWSLNPQNMVAVVVEAIQEVWAIVSGNQEKIDTLEGRVQYLESLLDVEVVEVSEPEEEEVEVPIEQPTTTTSAASADSGDESDQSSETESATTTPQSDQPQTTDEIEDEEETEEATNDQSVEESNLDTEQEETTETEGGATENAEESVQSDQTAGDGATTAE